MSTDLPALALGVTTDTFSECDEVNAAAARDKDTAKPRRCQPGDTEGKDAAKKGKKPKGG